MNKVIRYMIADYLSTAEAGAESPTFVFMNAGFTALDENPSAKIDSTPYVGDRSASGTITGYETTFPFDTHFISDEAAIKKIYDIARNQQTGADAECDYVRVDLYSGEENATTFPARKFRVAVEVTSISGAGTEIVKVAGNLHQVGNFVEGTFDTKSKTFTPKTAQ